MSFMNQVTIGKVNQISKQVSDNAVSLASKVSQVNGVNPDSNGHVTLPNVDATNLISKTDGGVINAKFPSPSTGLTACKADGTTDDTTALQALINYCATNKKTLYTPSGTYYTSTKLSIPYTVHGFFWYGDGNNNTIIDPHHNDYAIEFNGLNTNIAQSHRIKDIMISPQNASYRNAYNGVHVLNCMLTSLENVYIFQPLNGYVVEGASYVNKTDLLYIYNASNYGVWMKANGTGDAPNSNRIDIQYVCGTGKTVVGSCGIRVDNGTVNTFTDGQVSGFETGYYQANVGVNWVEKMWIENVNTSINLQAGTAYVNCHGAFLNTIASGARILNIAGQANPYQDYTHDMPKEDKNIKALWFFNEGSGTRILDKSGNKNHATLNGTATWTTDGTWGTAVYFKYSDGRTISIPTNTVDWTQPYTYMINYSLVNGVYTPPVGLYMYDSVTGNYFCAGQSKTSLVGLSNIGGVVENPATVATGRSGSSVTGTNIYSFIYVDPVNKIIESIDPFSNADAQIQMNNAFTISNPTLVTITGRNHVSNTNEGNMSMAGFWQRKLSRTEVLDIMNYTSRPFNRFESKVQLSTVLVSPNGSNYKITVSDAGALTATLV